MNNYYDLDKSKKEKINIISITSVLTALSIVFSFVCKFFILPYATWLNIDLSIIFQVFIYILIKNKFSIFYSLFSLFITSLSSMIWYGVGDIIGIFISFISGSLFILIFYMFSKIIYIKNVRSYYLVTLLLSSILTIILLTVLNGLIFTPLYWWYFGLSSISFIDCEIWYNSSPNVWLLNMPNYWSGIFVLYISFNSIKFLSSSILLFVILMTLSAKLKVEQKNNKKIKLYFI